MEKLVEDILIGDKLEITEDMYYLLKNINKLEDEINIVGNRKLIGKTFSVVDTFKVNGEGKGFIINDGVKTYRFPKACGTYLEIKN
jgi:hypothetical protein